MMVHEWFGMLGGGSVQAGCKTAQTRQSLFWQLPSNVHVVPIQGGQSKRREPRDPSRLAASGHHKTIAVLLLSGHTIQYDIKFPPASHNNEACVFPWSSSSPY
jgi:hypothetical protein